MFSGTDWYLAFASIACSVAAVVVIWQASVIRSLTRDLREEIERYDALVRAAIEVAAAAESVVEESDDATA